MHTPPHTLNIYTHAHPQTHTPPSPHFSSSPPPFCFSHFSQLGSQNTQGDLVIDGEKMPESLFKIVKAPLKVNKNNSVIGFKDNSSAIRGGPVTPVLPISAGAPCPLGPQERDWDVLLTAETHNFPCAVAPYPGAETGAGGRMRDTHATGIGSIMLAGTAVCGGGGEGGGELMGGCWGGGCCAWCLLGLGWCEYIHACMHTWYVCTYTLQHTQSKPHTQPHNHNHNHNHNINTQSQGYCTGNLQLEGYEQPWEPNDFVYPPNLATPEQVCFWCVCISATIYLHVHVPSLYHTHPPHPCPHPPTQRS